MPGKTHTHQKAYLSKLTPKPSVFVAVIAFNMSSRDRKAPWTHTDTPPPSNLAPALSEVIGSCSQIFTVQLEIKLSFCTYFKQLCTKVWWFANAQSLIQAQRCPRKSKHFESVVCSLKVQKKHHFCKQFIHSWKFKHLHACSMLILVLHTDTDNPILTCIGGCRPAGQCCTQCRLGGCWSSLQSKVIFCPYHRANSSQQNHWHKSKQPGSEPTGLWTGVKIWPKHWICTSPTPLAGPFMILPFPHPPHFPFHLLPPFPHPPQAPILTELSQGGPDLPGWWAGTTPWVSPAPLALVQTRLTAHLQ